MNAEVRPVIVATGELRKASSDCCAAKLDAGTDGGWFCRACGQPCGRVLGEAQEVIFRG